MSAVTWPGRGAPGPDAGPGGSGTARRPGAAPSAGPRMDWQAAACRDHDPELFFPVGDQGPALAQAERARRVCRRCPVAPGCLDWALARGVVDGIWGGLDAEERRRLRTR